MSDRLTASGLQSSAGLFGQCGVYEFDLNGSIFNPQDLNPYLLFDAETSMIGTLENPTLDLDPSKQETLDVITATRAGSATFVNISGEIETAQANTVRVDHSLGYPAMLIEPSATNLVTYSEDFSDSNWLKSRNGTGVAPVVTLNAAESPDGTQNATKIVFDSGTGTTTDDLSTLEDLFSTTNGASYTQSIYLKGETGGEKILVRSAGLIAYTTLTLTTEWTRYEVTETAIQTFGYYSIGLRQGLGGVVINSKITVYAYGAQVESGSVATSLIRTSGSNVTRAADDLVITGSAFSNFYNQSEGTVYVEFVPKLESLDATIFNFSDGSNFNRIMSLTKFYQIFVTTSGNTQVQFASGSVSLNNLNRLAASFKTNDCVLSLNGSSEVVDSSMAMPSINQINIGARFGGTEHLQGHIRRLLYWPVSSDSL